MATLTKMEANDQRMVLRIWRTQTVVQYGVSNVPLLLVSLTADGPDPVEPPPENRTVTEATI